MFKKSFILAMLVEKIVLLSRIIVYTLKHATHN